MDIIVAFICSYQLHRQADAKGLGPWRYIGQFWAGFIAIGFILAMIAIYLWGVDFMKNEETLKSAAKLSPFAIMFEILLYIVIRKRIQHVKVVYEEDEPAQPSPKDDKPDLSYFR